MNKRIRKESRTVLGLLLVVCLTIAGLPFSTQKVYAEDSATVKKVWATFPEEGVEGEPTGFVVAENQPENKDLYAKYITGGTYTMTEDDGGLLIWVNNADVNAIGYEPGGFELSGNSSLIFNGYTVTVSSTDKFPAYEGTEDGEVLAAFYSAPPYLDDEATDTWHEPYNYEVTGTWNFSGWLNTDNLIINTGATLTISNGSIGDWTYASFIDTNCATINGSVIIDNSEAGNENGDIEPNRLNIQGNGSLTLAEGGSLTGNGNALIEIRNDATVSGIDFYDSDGNTKYTDFTRTEAFYYAGNKWVRQGGNANEPVLSNNEYVVYYDSNNGAGVKVGDTTVNDKQKNSFSSEEELAFTLNKPEHRQENTPIIAIYVHNESNDVYRTNPGEGENQITLTGNSFSFTPTSNAPFEVFIDWSEYDAFGPTDNKPVLVELECEGEGTVNVADTDIANDDKIVDGNRTKVRVSESKAILTLAWEENRAPREVRVEGAGEEATEGWLVITPTGTSCEIPLTQTENNGPKTYYRVQVDFNSGGGSGEDSNGFKRLQTELNATYFAFGDIDNSGTADTNDLRYGVMRTLYDGFRVNEGRYQREGAALGLKEDFNKQDPSNLNANMEKLLSLATVNSTPISGDTITAMDKSGTSHTFNAYEVTITINKLYENRSDLSNFPNEEEATSLEESIVLTTKAYLIDMVDSSEQVIIKVKDNYFVRDAHSEEGGNEDDLEKFEGLNANALIIVSDFDKVSDINVFGNYASVNETLSDESSDCYFASGFGTGDGVKYLGDKFIVMKPAFLGVTINGKDEAKSPLAWSVESSLSVAETGKNKNTETDIYFGFHSVEIAPVTSGDVTELSVQGISAVEVLDGIPEHAVSVEETTPGSGIYTVHFLSDYYDTVRVKVTYSLTDGGTDSGIMTLNRVGIMIQGGMTAGDSHTVNIFHGHDMGAVLDGSVYENYKTSNSEKTHGEYKFAYYATYYYPTSSQATSADVSLFVTYTYEDGTVERKLLESNYFTPATNDNVAMSDYILYMGDGSNAPVKVEAIAVPNANADGTIQGAKLGAGKGVEKVFDFSE